MISRGTWKKTTSWMLLVALSCTCRTKENQAVAPTASEEEAKTPAVATPAPEKTKSASHERQTERERMVDQQLAARDVTDERVLAAMRKVPRHEFMPPDVRAMAYSDMPAPIGHEQTISQPYIVAKMTELAEVDANSKVLEIGTGSGYQAAILAEMADEVYSIEIVEPLAKSAEQTLRRLGYENVHVRHGDGYKGWPSQAPFDAIVVTAAPPKVPEPLKQQLAMGGRLVIPVGDRFQNLRVLTRNESGIEERSIFPVRFVPMTGKAQE